MQTPVTEVKNLDDPGFSAVYTLDAAQAVIAAFEQYSRGNWNTWQYPTPANCPDLAWGQSGRTVSRGPFCAMLPKDMRYFPAGTPARCNRCDTLSPTPKGMLAHKHNERAWRFEDMAMLACGHLDGHYVYNSDLTAEQ